MILVVGSSVDRVYPHVVSCLERSGHPFAVLDEEEPARYEVRVDGRLDDPPFRVSGADCRGRRPVGAIFVRHGVARTRDPGPLQELGRLQLSLNRLLLFCRATVVNRPTASYSNYAKPYQVALLADAGFAVPNSLVTNVAVEARQFYEECSGRVMFKGVSNVMTLARRLDAATLERLAHLPTSPTLFQEYVEGVDYRVHVVGETTFVTRLVSANEDYRRTLLSEADDVLVESVPVGGLPDDVIDRCVAVTRSLGLTLSGLDFKGTADGRFVALELNPYPQFTFYEARSGQPITRAVVDHLVRHDSPDTNVLA